MKAFCVIMALFYLMGCMGMVLLSFLGAGDPVQWKVVFGWPIYIILATLGWILKKMGMPFGA